MTSLPEYAALAAYVYNNERGLRSTTNRLDVPPTWAQLDSANGFPQQTSYDDNFFSFTAGAFVNQSTGEIVISYKGTDFLLELTGRAWNTLGDLATDVAAGMAGYLSLPQFVQAAAYYQDVKTWAAQNGYDASKISFTGHSLGAGIASVMSVWFNRPATVFADAPFEAVAHNALAMAAITATLAAKGTPDADFAAYLIDAAIPGTPTFFSRQEQVKNYFVQGEFLDLTRSPPSAVYGTTTPITIGSPALGQGESMVDRALALHSMNLHAALLFDDRKRLAAAP